MKGKTVLITGAAGNLGTLTSRHFLQYSSCRLNLMYHNKRIADDIAADERVSLFRCDMADTESLMPALRNADTVIHFATVLFKTRPKKFPSGTNVLYFRNLLDAVKRSGVKKLILVSFPHVEGPTTPERPSTDRIDGNPISDHAITRLEAERIMLREMKDPIILRVGMVYGRGMIMPDVGRWFARRWLLGVWSEPTYIHLISKWDFCESVMRAALKPGVRGTYNIGDDGIQTLQEFLDFACARWKTKRPWRMPLWMIYLAASVFESFSDMFNTVSPLTKDFIDVARVSYYGDTRRMKKDLVPKLRYKNMVQGKDTF